MADVTETRVANKYFSVRITVENLPPGSTLRDYLNATRGNVMRFFNQAALDQIRVCLRWGTP